MLIEISSLPPVLEKAILQGEAVEFAQNGKVIAYLTDTRRQMTHYNNRHSTKSYANGDFNFDLDLMKEWVEGS